jgi:hypothetical protein
MYHATVNMGRDMAPRVPAAAMPYNRGDESTVARR